MQLTSDRRYSFPVEVAALWAAVADLDRYPQVWPWLKHFDASGLRAGDVWRCRVKPPLPYSVRFTIALDEVVRARHVTATIAGDISGVARLDFEATATGSGIRLTSSLAPSGRAFAVFATVMRPLVGRGHDWVLDTGAAQFARSLQPDVES